MKMSRMPVPLRIIRLVSAHSGHLFLGTAYIIFYLLMEPINDRKNIIVLWPCDGHNVRYGDAVASLGLVSPGAATDRVIPIFFLKKTDDLF